VYRETKKKQKKERKEGKKRFAIKQNTTIGEFGTFIINPIYFSGE